MRKFIRAYGVILCDVIIANMAAACFFATEVKAGLLVLLSVFAAQGSTRGPCDPLTPEYCQLPWPNSFFTRPDADSATGVRVNLSLETWPKDIAGRSIDPAEWNRMGELYRTLYVCTTDDDRRLLVCRSRCGRRVGGAGVRFAYLTYNHIEDAENLP